MPRITITLSNYTYDRIVRMSTEENTSQSNTINYLIHLALHSLDEEQKDGTLSFHPVEKHCHQLTIQMNVLIKHMCAVYLKMTQDDFDRLKQAAVERHQQLIKMPKHSTLNDTAFSEKGCKIKSETEKEMSQ